MAKGRFRLQFKFWLDVNKPEEYALAEIIADLKENKTFSKVIRDGIRLIWSLGQGDLDVLLTLFPWVEDTFYERFKEQQPASDSVLQQQLARLERRLVEQGSVAVETSPKKLVIPEPALPLVEDTSENLLVVKRMPSERESARNFLDAAFNLVQ